MQTRHLTFALLLAFAPVALQAPVSFAQQGDPTINAARARFQEGVEFYDKGQYENARASFLQAYALRKHPAVLLNLAQSSLRSNHTLDAAHYFQQYLRESSGLTAAQRTLAEQGLAEARQKLGHIEVSALAGADVFVDNERVGTAPLAEAVDVEPGSHMVKARTDELKVDVAAGQRVTARFGAGGPVAIPVVVAPPIPPPALPPVAPPPVAPPVASGNPSTFTTMPPPPGADKKTSMLSPPATMIPVIVGAGVAIIGAGLAIGVGVVAKSSAQTSADGKAADIRAHGGRQGICSSTVPAEVTRFGKACAALSEDNNTVDSDALVGNVGIGLAVAGGVFAVGWYLLAPKAADKKIGTWQMPTISPILGTRTNGMALSGTF